MASHSSSSKESGRTICAISPPSSGAPRHAAEFARLLFSMPVEKMPTIIDRVRYIHTQMSMVKWWPEGVPELAAALAERNVRKVYERAGIQVSVY